LSFMPLCYLGNLLKNKVLISLVTADIDPWTLTNMWNIHNGEPSRDTNKGDAWSQMWNKSQRDAAKPTTIIYDDDARRVILFT